MRFISGVVWVYIAIVCAWIFFDGYQHSPLLSAFIIMFVSLLSVYGIISMWRDVEAYGWEYVWLTLKNFLGL